MIRGILLTVAIWLVGFFLVFYSAFIFFGKVAQAAEPLAANALQDSAQFSSVHKAVGLSVPSLKEGNDALIEGEVVDKFSEFSEYGTIVTHYKILVHKVFDNKTSKSLTEGETKIFTEIGGVVCIFGERAVSRRGI